MMAYATGFGSPVTNASHDSNRGRALNPPSTSLRLSAALGGVSFSNRAKAVMSSINAGASDFRARRRMKLDSASFRSRC
jgi:hypothetical protein